MKVTIRNPVRREIALDGSLKVHQLLAHLNLNPESHIVIRDEELLTSQDIIGNDDAVQIVSAISGG
ncbi:MoaD/ThiS family protein [SAR202 cluster bacterium AC-409-J13_OGT_754m]|nr:MoaD/ThiS family protein [SAR202 cluster bacterium AC-409-J13_OGT_754m]